MTNDAEHLREHLTDGRWHDDCDACLARRRFGGTGLGGRSWWGPVAVMPRELPADD